MRRNFVFALCLAAGFGSASFANEERYTGYYYPPVTSEETFTRTIAPDQTSYQAVRVNFVTAITKAQLAAPESPRYTMFEKGGLSEHLIIVALDDEIFLNDFPRPRSAGAAYVKYARHSVFP